MTSLLEAGVSRVRTAKTIHHENGLRMGLGLRVGLEWSSCIFVQVLTAEDCRSDRFLWELQLIEKNEVRLKQSLLWVCVCVCVCCYHTNHPSIFPSFPLLSHPLPLSYPSPSPLILTPHPSPSPLTFHRFSTALFEAVEQSNDAIQITGHNSIILVSHVMTRMTTHFRLMTAGAFRFI